MSKKKVPGWGPTWRLMLALSVFIVATAGRQEAGTQSASNGGGNVKAYGKLPLHFEANRGQTASAVKFLSRGSRHTLFLTQTEAVLVLTKPEQAAEGKPEARTKATGIVLRMTFPGARRELSASGQEELPGKANYFIGNDPGKWQTNVPIYARVRYKNLYPGIDLVYYGNQRQLEYDFVVTSGADPNRIALGFEGADKLEVNAQADLVIHTAAGPIRMQKPFVYQEYDGVRREIPSGYVLKNANEVGFNIAVYDAARPLVIDPVLFYSTFVGGSGLDVGNGIVADLAGNAYITGQTASPNFPTTPGGFQTAYNGGGSDVFVAKLNPTGSGLVYSTYLGGNGSDAGQDIVIDTAGNAYVAGLTDSVNLPTTPGAFQTAYAGGAQDAFLAKLNPTGSGLIYATYLGGSGQDQGLGISVDATGNAYVVGLTASINFPTTPGAFQTSYGGGTYDAFVAKANSSGSALVYSTYVGGSGQDQGHRIAVDATDNAYITGLTNSVNFPTASPLQPANAGSFDNFVTKVSMSGTGLIYSTYLGGIGDDSGFGIAVDSVGNAYVAGETGSTNFPTTPGAFQTTYGGGVRDATLSKLNSTGSMLVYSTFLGGTGLDQSFRDAVDATGNAYLTGITDSTDFPTANPFQAANAGGSDAFVTKVNLLGTGLVYSSYLGGSSSDQGFGIALDALPAPNAYVTGRTASTDFPTTAGAFQTTFGGGSADAFVTKITDVMLPPPPTVGKVTGGGTIFVPGGIGNFGFIVQARSTSGPIGGNLQYRNHVTGVKVRSVMFTSLVIAGNMATFSGTCTADDAPCTFTVDVTDNGEPGTNDTFTISVSAGPPEGGTLRSGNIQIHK